MNYAEKYYEEQIANCAYNEYLTTGALETELRQFFTTVKFRVSNADSRTRDIYNILIEQAAAVNPVTWLDEPEVFISTTSAKNGKKKIPYAGLAGAVILIALVIRFALAKTTPDLITAVLIGVGLAAFVVQLVLLWLSLSAKPQQNVRTEQRVSSEKFKAGLLQIAKTLDSHADTIYHALNAVAATTASSSVSDAELALVLDLIRLPDVKQNRDITDTIDRYLVSHEITKLDYTEDNAHLFDVLPSNSTMTIVPALIRNSEILNRGVACKNMEEQ